MKRGEEEMRGERKLRERINKGRRWEGNKRITLGEEMRKVEISEGEWKGEARRRKKRKKRRG